MRKDVNLKISSGWIARPKVDRKGLTISLDMTELITCKECKHYSNGNCEWHGGFKPDEDWFCADGEVKNE